MKTILLLFLIPQLSFAVQFEKIDDLVDFTNVNHNKLITNIHQISDSKLERSKLDISPWKGYHWPISSGLLSNRYNDSDFTRQGSWKYYYQQFKDKTALDYINENNIFYLSPAEKYDLLIGDMNFTLSKKMWEIGKAEVERHGEIKRWAGVSHGLALATIKLPKPFKAIKLWSVDKKYLIPFTSDDIKALGALLYGPGSYNAISIGEICNENRPERDQRNRLLKKECFDVHPAKFHLALVNYLGKGKKPFMIDGSFNTPVWNYPVLGYEFKYFNPKQINWLTDLNGAIIAKANFHNDRFINYRQGDSKYIVGVEAKIYFNPYRLPNSETTNRNPRVYVYRYDLELDGNHNIIGGEWHSLKRPDFIWHPPESFKPNTPADMQMTGTWRPTKEHLFSDWALEAKKASQHGAVTAKIIKALFDLSNKGMNGFETR